MQKSKVLLIGGTGVAGKCILNHLSNFFHLCDITIASRGVIPSESHPDVAYMKLDLFQANECEDSLKMFDIIILALGPFFSVGLEVYRICLKNGIVCIDINDEYEHLEKLSVLSSMSPSNPQGRVLTGMGLCPGLTSLMLHIAAIEFMDTTLEAGVRLYFGAGVRSGKASIDNMFHAFRNRLIVLSQGQSLVVKPGKYKRSTKFSFDPEHQKVSLTYFSSPEVATLRHNQTFKNLKDFDAAFHLQNFPKWLIYLSRKYVWVNNWCRNMAYKQQQDLADNKWNERIVLVNVQVADGINKRRISLTATSSFELTGAFCAAIVVMLLRGQISMNSVVSSFDDLSLDLTVLQSLLQSFGLNIIKQ